MRLLCCIALLVVTLFVRGDNIVREYADSH